MADTRTHSNTTNVKVKLVTGIKEAYTTTTFKYNQC